MSDGRVADAQHQHPLALQHVGLAVVVDVDLLAGELLGAGEGRFGPARVPVVPVGDQHGAVAMGLSRLPSASSTVTSHSPSTGSTLSTSVRKRIFSRRPKWST